MRAGCQQPPRELAPQVEQVVNVDCVDNDVLSRCPETTNRLLQLAPLHRRAALRRAQADAGINGLLPSLDDLRMAEVPPEPVWKLDSYSVPSLPSACRVADEARRVLADPSWRAELPSLPRHELERQARRRAEDRLIALWQAGPVASRTLLNGGDVERGQALAAQHGPLLVALRILLDGLDDVVPRSSLAASDEEEVCRLGAVMQRVWQRLRVATADEVDGAPPPRTGSVVCAEYSSVG